MDIRTGENGEHSATLRTQAEIKAAYLSIRAFRRQLKNRQIEPAGGRSDRRALLKQSRRLISQSLLWTSPGRELPLSLENGERHIDMVALGAKSTIEVLGSFALYRPPQREGDLNEQRNPILDPDSITALEQLAALDTGAIRIAQ